MPEAARDGFYVYSHLSRCFFTKKERALKQIILSKCRFIMLYKRYPHHLHHEFRRRFPIKYLPL